MALIKDEEVTVDNVSLAEEVVKEDVVKEEVTATDDTNSVDTQPIVEEVVTPKKRKTKLVEDVKPAEPVVTQAPAPVIPHYSVTQLRNIMRDLDVRSNYRYDLLNLFDARVGRGLRNFYSIEVALATSKTAIVDIYKILK